MDLHPHGGASSCAGPGVCARLRAPLTCAALALLAVGAAACGSAGERASPAPARSSGASATGSAAAGGASRPADLFKRDGDGDIDRLTQGSHDGDGDAIPTFGPPAGAADRRAILALFRRYYANAAAGDGARACSMMDIPAAESVVEEHSRGKGPRSLQGKTCAQIMSTLFKRRHRELMEDIAGYRVLAVQVHGGGGLVLVRFPAKRELRELRVIVRRDHGAWRMAVPLDAGAQ
jgi:hypothetical protein